MTRQEFIGVLDKEIEHHKRIYLHSSSLAGDYKDGFIKGLEQARNLMVQAHIAQVYPETASFTDVRERV